MKNKTIAFIGIGTYILSVLSSATDLAGNPTAPIALVFISGTATIIFYVAASIRLWKTTRLVATAFAASYIARSIFDLTQAITPPENGSLMVILANIAKVINLVAFIWAIITLYNNDAFIVRLAQHEELARSLSGMERKSVELANQIERAQLFFPLSAISHLLFFYGSAGGIWGLAIGISLLWSALVGILLGVVITFTICSFPIFAPIDTMEQVRNRQFFIGMWVKLAIILGGVGMIVLAVRSLIRF